MASRAESDKTRFSPPSDNKDLIAWLVKKCDTGKPRVSDLQMKLNLSYVQGQQWLVWDGGKRAYRRPQNRPGDPNAPIRVTVNRIAPLVESNTSRLTKSVPTPECRPVGDQDADVGAAKVGTRVLASECNRIKWDTQLTKLYASWVHPLGWSYLHFYWNPDAGDKIGAGPETGVELYEGNVECEIVPGFELDVDPNALCMEDAGWARRTVSMTEEAIYERWNKVPDGGESGQTLADEVTQLVEVDGRARPQTDFIKVHQFWLRPGGRAHPEGMVVTWAGNTILEGPMPFPYDHGKLPFVQFDLLPGIGTREGRTWVTDLIPLQTDYNDARSREAMIRRTLVPKILSPTGSIDPKRVTSRVEIITYNPTGQQPQFMLPDGRWMAQYEAAMDRSVQEMGDRAGAADVSQGNAPTSMPAAAILALQEADDTKLAITAKMLARSTEDCGFQMLMLVKQFWSEDRIVRTWSEDNTLQVDHFSSRDLQHGFDIHVSSESALPRSKAARTQLAMDLWTQGIIQDPRIYVSMLELPGTEFIGEMLSLDAKHAHRENDRLRQGEEQEVHHWDNHQVHLTEHNNFRKTVDYEQMDDEDRIVFDAHCALHEQMVLPQMGNPAGPGDTLEMAQTGPIDETDPLNAPEYVNPATGQPNDPTAVASGQAPSALEGSTVKQKAGIGGPGEPGEVPGVSTDTQAFRQGA